MNTITIELLGLQTALNAFSALEARTTSLRPLWEKFADEFYIQERQLFDAAPWKPLTPAYAERKRRIFGDKPILRATDTLFHSLTQKGAEGSIYRVLDQEVEFGSSVPYGIFHVPTRNPLAEPDEDRYLTIAGEYLVEAVRESGFN